MAGPSSKPERTTRAPLFVPHEDDKADVRDAFDETKPEALLSPEESAAYVRWLETGEAPDHLKQYFETGERPCPASGD
jgi:hypothetical protein